MGTVQYNRAAADAVQSFHVVLCDQPKQVTLLRECLKRLCYLEDLEIILPRLSPSRWGRLLRGLKFRRLDLLRTNAPHSVVAEFLEEHQNVAFLSVQSCGRTRKPCPLDGRELRDLCDVSGPLGCVSALVRNNPVSRIAVRQSFGTAPAPFFVLVPSLLMSTTHITVLELELSPTDFDVLDCLATGTPALKALKLIEVQGVALVSSSRIHPG